jgi:hypothetical protein
MVTAAHDANRMTVVADSLLWKSIADCAASN